MGAGAVMVKKPHGITTPGGITHAERVIQAIDLARVSTPWDEIAAQCGYSSRGAAHKAVTRALEKAVRQSVAGMVALESGKLDALEEQIMPQALKKGKRQIAAVKVELSIQARRARLNGLDDFERRSIELAERRETLDAAQAGLVYEALHRIFNRLDLTNAQRLLLPVVVPEELARVADAELEPPEDMGETP